MPVRSPLLVGACLLWGASVVGGFVYAGQYSGSAGVQAAPPAAWPQEARVARDAERPTLLLFAHPECPCTAATIAELGRLLAHVGERASVTVLFRADPATDSPRGGLREAVAALPGVAVLEDELGVQARLFGARTSGQVLLYAPDGSLLFAGGLTPARGHEGDSAGRAALQELILHGRGADHAPVFGCALFAADAP